MLKERVDKVKYIIKHRKEFRRVEKEFIGKNTIRGYLHDLLKIPIQTKQRHSQVVEFI